MFGTLKLKFGFNKVRYRGLKKNANRVFATLALVNLFTVPEETAGDGVSGKAEAPRGLRKEQPSC